MKNASQQENNTWLMQILMNDKFQAFSPND